MVGLVLELPLGEPAGQFLAEVVAAKVLAPQGAVLDPGLRQRAVEVEHADQPGPLAGPVGDGADRTAVGRETVKHVMRILPDRFGDDQGRVGIDAIAEDVHPLLLRLDEAVLLIVLVRMRADQLVAARVDGGSELFFHRLLRGPADAIGAEAQVAVGDELDLFLREFPPGPVFSHGRN